MIKKYLFFLLLFNVFNTGFSQYLKLSEYSEVSIITAGPGEELFTAFGHSAIRIKDPIFQIDLIYNYGMFDWSAPNFYVNFVKGKMLYKIARYPFHYFVTSNKKESRWVKQQTLALTKEEKQAFFEYLETNAKPENASYLYDPYFNNCATKLRDISTTILGDKIKFQHAHLTEKLSLRQLMNKEIHWNTWGNFGINLALGTTLDKIATPEQYLYLPDYIFEGFKNASITKNNQVRSIVKQEKTIVDFQEKKQAILILNPFLIFSMITFVGLWITYKDIKNAKRTKLLDFTLFFITGIIGCLIVFLWFFTDHATTPNNFNFLWAFAPNLFIAFLLLKKQLKSWLKGYIIFVISLVGLSLIIWIAGIQLLPITILPLLILLIVRYGYLIKSIRKATAL